MMINTITAPQWVEFVNYRQKQIDIQQGLDGDDKRMLNFIQFCAWRNRKSRACELTDLEIAEALGWSYNQVRKRAAKLRKSGHLVTIGYKPRGDAIRRVRLFDQVIAGVKGAVIPFQINGRTYYRKRKTSEKNPAVQIVEKVQGSAPDAVQHIVGIVADQNPIIPSDEGMELSFLVQTESVDNKVGSCEFVSPITPVQDPDPTTNTPVEVPGDPTTTNPVTVPGKRDWVAKFNQLEVAGLLKAQFGLTDITPRLARSICGHVRRGTFNAAGLRFVLERFDTLPTDGKHIARKPVSLEDMLTRYVRIRDHLTESLRRRVQDRLQRESSALHGVQTVVEQLSMFKAAHWCRNWTSYADFVADREHGDRRLAWVVAYYFHQRGEDILEVDGGVSVAFSCVCNPEVYDWASRHLNFNLSEITGFTKAEVMQMRDYFVSQTRIQRSEATKTSSFEMLVEADEMSIEAQLYRAADTGELPGTVEQAA